MELEFGKFNGLIGGMIVDKYTQKVLILGFM